VQRVTDQVDPGFLEQSPPRPLPYVVVLNILGDYTFERPFSAFLDPLLIVGVVTLIVLIALHTRSLLCCW